MTSPCVNCATVGMFLLFRWLQGGSFNEVELIVATQLTSQPEEGFLEVVVGLCRNIVVLKILLTVEGDLLGLHLTVFDLDLVSGQNNWDVFADTGQVTVPVGHVLVSDTGCHVKHDDGTLALNVVTITESTEFL